MVIKKIYLILGIVFSLLMIVSLGVWVFQRTNLNFSKFFRVELTENPTYIFSSDFDSEKVTLYGIGIGDRIKDKKDLERKTKKWKDIFLTFLDYKEIAQQEKEELNKFNECPIKMAGIEIKGGEEIVHFWIINDRVEALTIENNIFLSNNPIIEKLVIRNIGNISERLGFPEKVEESEMEGVVKIKTTTYHYPKRGINITWEEIEDPLQYKYGVSQIVFNQKGRDFFKFLQQICPTLFKKEEIH
jgi:hypothetical protein